VTSRVVCCFFRRSKPPRQSVAATGLGSLSSLSSPPRVGARGSLDDATRPGRARLPRRPRHGHRTHANAPTPHETSDPPIRRHARLLGSPTVWREVRDGAASVTRCRPRPSTDAREQERSSMVTKTATSVRSLHRCTLCRIHKQTPICERIHVSTHLPRVRRPIRPLPPDCCAERRRRIRTR
jgi:hypothetical protein